MSCKLKTFIQAVMEKMKSSITWIVVFLAHVLKCKKKLEICWLGIMSNRKAHLKGGKNKNRHH